MLDNVYCMLFSNNSLYLTRYLLLVLDVYVPGGVDAHLYLYKNRKVIKKLKTKKVFFMTNISLLYKTIHYLS